MTTALTIASTSHEIAVVPVPSVHRVSVDRARTKSEIIERIRECSAAVADIALFIRDLGHVLDQNDLKVVEKALARAYYREGRPLTVRQVAILASWTAMKTTEKQVRSHMRYLGIAMREVLSNHDASRVLCRINEPDTN